MAGWAYSPCEAPLFLPSTEPVPMLNSLKKHADVRIRLYIMLESLDNLEPSGDTAHCLRVAAYCREIASQLGFPGLMNDALYNAALMHHEERQLADLASLGLVLTSTPQEPPSITEQILAPYQISPDLDPALRLSREILAMADFFDEELEDSAYADHSRTTMLALEVGEPLDHPPLAFVLAYLRRIDRTEVEQLISKMPVFRSSALELLRISSAHDVELRDLVRVAKSDQVLAGAVLQRVNSALYAVEKKVASIERAVSLLGTEATRKVLVAAALRPLLCTPQMPDLWTHSQEAAQAAQALARLTKAVPPDEAYMLGLVHDIGRLLLQLLPSPVRNCCERLQKDGVQSAIAELLTCGISHAEAGGMVLRTWHVPEEYIVATMHHHEPENCDSPLAALLYLVEFWLASDEDAPSQVRLQVALSRLGITMEQLQSMQNSWTPELP
jgi:HD-like signal output (HDOD) protein